MYHSTQLTEPSAFTVDFLQLSELLMDNDFASIWQLIGMREIFYSLIIPATKGNTRSIFSRLTLFFHFSTPISEKVL